MLDVLVDCGSVLMSRTCLKLVAGYYQHGCRHAQEVGPESASIMGDAESVFRNGKLGTLDRFTVYISNNMSIVDDVNCHQKRRICLATKGYDGFASQMTQMETLPNPQDPFGKLIPWFLTSRL